MSIKSEYKVSIKAVTFVDDINGSGSRRFIQEVIGNCKKKEDKKLWEFSIEKSNWMCVKNRKKEVPAIEGEIKQGKVQQTKVYKFLGNYVNEKGNMDDQLKDMEKKAVNVAREANKICSQHKVGKFEYEAKKLIYVTQGVPAVYYNVEVWTNLRKSDVAKLKSIQGQLLKKLFGLPKSTSYLGLLYELNITPIIHHILYKKLMLFHNLINSDDRRIAKKIVQEQAKSGHEGCWFGNLREESMEIGLDLNEEMVVGKIKSRWKKEVKDKIEADVERIMEMEMSEGRKMRFLRKRKSG